MVLQPGTWVTETVKLKTRIGGGGMAEVWRAEHVTLGVDVAVKCLAPRLARQPEILLRFLAEARIAAQLNGPYTVRVLDCVVRRQPGVGDLALIVMELLEGEDLKQYLARGDLPSLHVTAAIVQQVARALGTAHGMGFIHRDVKPENVFLTTHGGHHSIKLLDFGLAKDRALTRGITMIGMTLGTPHYMSPEQVAGVPDLDMRCDIWSLAVVAYLCLTGQLPFQGKTMGAVASAIHHGRFCAPSRLRRELPAGIDRIFARAFTPAIDARFPRAADLADALLEGARHELPPPTACPAGHLARPVQHGRA
jgi:serine/threonine-protein kinase